ncbi:MAG: uroporphyrin-III C-methyltransferase [Campylobacterota bacterium]|nr:uroporphyrin-III C-methyltransferase [Campylobacterota bacterium]
MNGSLYLIGCGPGDADLLTLKALTTLQRLDVALIDHLLTQEIIDLIPTHTKVVFVGKKKGYHSSTQDEINTIIASYALQGLRVGRLKCGDPYVFGRGTEEAIYAMERGIHTEVIPGISSALSGPLSAGIAPTARGYATGMSIVSAHLAGDRVNLDWIPLLGMPRHTTIVLMGLSRAGQISAEALKQGISPALSVAIVSNATSTNQSTLITTLNDLASAAQKAPKPAIMIFGDVVALESQLPKYIHEIKEATHDITLSS